MIRMRVSVPKIQDSKAHLDMAIRSVAYSLNSRVGKTYNDLTGSWNDKPEFDMKVTTRGNVTTSEVKTGNLKYRWIDLGTGPRDIVPRKDNPTGMLVFHGPYKAATKPRSLVSRKKSVGTSKFVLPIVRNHEIKARHFEIPIYEEQKPIIVKELQKSLGDHIRKHIKVSRENI